MVPGDVDNADEDEEMINTTTTFTVDTCWRSPTPSMT
jgi:hypothetical protein